MVLTTDKHELLLSRLGTDPLRYHHIALSVSIATGSHKKIHINTAYYLVLQVILFASSHNLNVMTQQTMMYLNIGVYTVFASYTTVIYHKSLSPH